MQVGGEGKKTLPFPPACEKVTSSPEIVPVAPETVAVQGDERPTSKPLTPEGPHETEVVGLAWVTVTLALPELAALSASPGYDAWIVTIPGEPPLTGMEQSFPERVQVAGDGNETLPVPPDWENSTVSPSVVPTPPDTATLHVELASVIKERGAHETEVLTSDRGA